MKLAQILENVVRTPENDGHCDIEMLAEIFHLNPALNWDAIGARLHGYWVIRRCHQGDYVGLKALYLDETLVGYATKDLADAPELIKFISAELGYKVRDWLLECAEGISVGLQIASKRWIQTFGPDFAVEYTADIQDCQGFFKGERVDFAEPGDIDNISDCKLKVRTTSGMLTINVSDYRMPIHTKGNWPLPPLPALG